MAEPNLKEIYTGILEGNRTVVREKVQVAIHAGLKAEVILNGTMIPAMTEVGRRFESGDYYLPEMLIAAKAMQDGLAILKPYMVEANIQSPGKVVVGTVHGDLHDIGKNLVCIMLEGAGFEIHDLGTDISAERFIEAIRTQAPDIVAMSALLTTTMANMKIIVDAIKKAGLRDNVKIMVGGAPLTADFAHDIGADGYAPDASGAVRLAKSLIMQ